MLLNGVSTGTPEGPFRENILNSVLGFTISSVGITRESNADCANTDSWRDATSSDLLY